MRVFIVGINGFIGNALAKKILELKDWNVTGIDIDGDRLDKEVMDNSKFEFYHGDISINKEWVEFQIKRSDVVVPLAAVAIPKVYVDNPLLVFELDFKENLRIIELAAHYNKRIVFPSTSEVYGMCQDNEFDEENSNFILGPINKQRWIYSCGKQLLDRVIHAHGLQHNLSYTLFRPFNWIGPHLDRIDAKKIGNSRVLTEFISSVVFNKEITLVDGGNQRRSFLYLDDGIDCLIKILADGDNGPANKQIFNIGNPENEHSIKEVANLVVDLYSQHPRSLKFPFTAGIVEQNSQTYYGTGYQDVESRMPSIRKPKEILSWAPKYNLETSIQKTLESFLSELND